LQSSELPEFDALWDYDDPAGTESRFRELVPQAIESGNRDYHAELLTQIARTQGLQRQFADAHNTLDRVEDLLPQAGTRPRIRYLLERGRVFNSSKESDSARPLFVEAWELSRSANEDNLAVDAAHMVAIVEPTDGQIEWNTRAMDLAESSPDPKARRWLASLYNNLGWTFHDRGEYEKALDLFQRAQRFREERGEAGPIRIARWAVARALRSLGHTEEALTMQWNLKAEHTTAGSSDGYVDEELGECLYALGRAAEAKPHFEEAYRLLSQDPWLSENERQRIERLRTLAS